MIDEATKILLGYGVVGAVAVVEALVIAIMTRHIVGMYEARLTAAEAERVRERDRTSEVTKLIVDTNAITGRILTKGARS